MGYGWANAIEEFPLVLFTTLTPSAVVAYLIVAIGTLSRDLGGSDDPERARLRNSLVVTLVLASIGLIAAALHLGNPANALYVFAGVGRSPLSNEVLAVIAFLMLSGVFWMLQFSVEPHRTAMGLLYALIAVAAVIVIALIGYAYHVDTVLTWVVWQVPASIAMNALLGGVIVAECALRLFDVRPAGPFRSPVAVCAMLIVAGAACLAVHATQGMAFPDMRNAYGTAAQLVPLYWWGLAGFAVFELAASVIVVLDLRSGPSGALGKAGPVVAIVLAYAGMLVMRFMFYMSHLTVGLGF